MEENKKVIMEGVIAPPQMVDDNPDNMISEDVYKPFHLNKEVALTYAEKGFKVFPVNYIMPNGRCSCQGKVNISGKEVTEICARDSPGKHPVGHLAKRGCLSATTRKDVIERWWIREPLANIGLAAENFVALDIDGEEGLQSLLELDINNEIINPNGSININTPISKTGRNGYGKHILFKVPDDIKIENSVKFLPGLDFRAKGGYIVVAPSNHISGNNYVWEKSILDYEPVEMPQWLKDAYKESQERKRISEGQTKLPLGNLKEVSLIDQIEPASEIPEHQRNDTLFKEACLMRGKGASKREIEDFLLIRNKFDCKPPLSENEVKNIIISSLRYEPNKKYYELNELGNADRFADLYGNNLKYCTTSKEWLHWDDKLWVSCDHLEEERYCKTIPEEIKKEAESIDEDMKKAYLTWYKASASYQKLKNILNIARSDNRFTISINDFLSDTRYFNMQNGVLDTETFEFLPHDRSRMLSKISNVVYNPEAKCPRWLDMMDMIFADPKTMEPNVKLIKYVQRVMGYVLTGKPINQAWFTFYGPKSKNGKSTFCNAISYALGNYAKKVNIKTFLNTKNKSSIPNDIAALAGYYFIWASEPEDGSKLSMEIIKPFSGNEEMDARFLNKEFFQFKPSGSIFILTNNRLNIDEKGDAAWRRANSIPFEVQIPEEKRILDIDSLLQQEAAGIFNWMLEGLKDYYKLGKQLNPPKKVIESNAEYREDMNSFKKFWDECITFTNDGRIRPTCDFWISYKRFCDENGLESGMKKEFVKQFKEYELAGKIEGKWSHNQQFWIGVREKTDEEKNGVMEISSSLGEQRALC